MATVNKDFKIKQGLVVEGTTGTIGGNNILTEGGSDQYIIDLIGGETLITSVDSTDFAVTGGELAIAGGSDIARTGDITSALSDALAVNGDIANAIADAVPDTTDDLSEGVNNLYYSNNRVRGAFDYGQGINYDSMTYALSVDIASGTGLQFVDGQLDLDRTQIDTWYDASGSAATQAGYAQGNAEAYADTVAGYAQGNAYSYAQDAVDNAVAEANDYTDNAVATKQDTLTEGNGIAISGSTISVDVAEISGFAFHQDYIDLGQKNNSIALPKINLTNYTDTLYDAIGSADTAYNNAVAYADSVYDNAVAHAEGYTDNAVASLVDSAPELLDTLNELAAALQDNPNVISDLQDIAAGKQDALTSGEGIYIDGNNIITSRHYSGGGLKFVFDEAAIDRTTVDAWYDAAGAANTAYDNATSYADGLAGNYDSAGSADTAYNNAISYADTAASNAYTSATSYADGLAVNYDAAGSAANAQTAAESYAYTQAQNAYSNAQSYADDVAADAYSNSVSYVDTALENLDLSGNYDALGAAANALIDAKSYADEAASNAQTIAEGYAYDKAQEAYTNAVAYADGLTTDDVAEGLTNKYFSDSLALDAIIGETIQPNIVDITWVRREEAAYTSVASPSTTTCHSADAVFGSMKYLVRVTAPVSGTQHSHVTEILATVDSANNVAVVEYGTIYTSTNPLATVTVEWNAGTSTYDLNVTTVNNSSEVLVAATLIKTQD